MRIPMKFSARKPYSVFSEITRIILTVFLIGAIVMGLYYGGKAAGREEILRSDMWTDSCGTIYIDTPFKVVAHENLAENIY